MGDAGLDGQQTTIFWNNEKIAMRVISGKYKMRRFDVPRTFKARPTTDFAKENLFNVLTNLVDFTAGPRALDLFAGTGSISLELLSRGCSQVVSVEKDREHYTFILRVMHTVGAEGSQVIRGDVLRYLRDGRGGPFDLIFADPPYQLPELPQLPDLILDSGLLGPNGLFILEHGKTHRFDTHPCFHSHRAYGSVNFSLFTASVESK